MRSEYYADTMNEIIVERTRYRIERARRNRRRWISISEVHRNLNRLLSENISS